MASGRHLAGLRYDPPPGVTPIASVLYLHGKGGNFYSGPPRFVPDRCSARRLRQLALNMRAHDLGYTRDDVPYIDLAEGGAVPDGGFWERLSQGWEDVDCGVAYLRSLGPEPVFVAGHSSGGFYVADYCARRSNVAGRILLSPLTSNKRPLPYWFGGDAGCAEAVRHARELVESGRGHFLIPLDRWFWAISAASLLERWQEPDDVWLTAMRACDAPVLCVAGGTETRVADWRSLIAQVPAVRKEFVILEGTDHHYTGAEDQVARIVGDFVEAVASASGAMHGTCGSAGE